MRIPRDRTVDFSILKSQFKTVPSTEGLFRIRILDLSNGEARLSFEGRSLSARVDPETLPFLQKGQELTVRLLQGPDGIWILQSAQGTPAGEAAADALSALLYRSGYRPDPLNLLKARLLVACRMPVTEAALQSVDRLIAGAGLEPSRASVAAAVLYLSRPAVGRAFSFPEFIGHLEKPAAPQSFLDRLASELDGLFATQSLLPGKKQILTHRFIRGFMKNYLIDLPGQLDPAKPLSLESRLFNIGEKAALVLDRLSALSRLLTEGGEASAESPEAPDAYLKGKQEDFLKAQRFQAALDASENGPAPLLYFALPTEFHDRFGLFEVFHFSGNGDQAETGEDPNPFLMRVCDPVLGTLVFEVRLAPGKRLALSLEADSRATLVLLKRHLPRLRQNLEASGYRLGEVRSRLGTTDIFEKIASGLDKPVRKLDINI